MITLKDVTKRYTHQKKQILALDRVSLHVPAGPITMGVIGKSGAGKSSLVRCINLIEKPTQGKVWVNGLELTALDMTALRAARRNIGMIFQSFNLLSHHTVYQNIALPLLLLQESKSKIASIIEPILALTGLKNKANVYPNQLSGGEKQRVGIARALVCNPKVLLCDEATSALDPQTTFSILRLLKELQQQLKLTILLITHEIEVVKAICDEVALIEKGKIIEQSDIVHFFTQPESSLAKDFVQTALHQTLPETLQEALYSQPKPTSHVILRLFIYDSVTIEPLIAYLMRDIGIPLSILQSHLECIKDKTLGSWLVKMVCHPEKFSKAMMYLNDSGVRTEVMGYVD